MLYLSNKLTPGPQTPRPTDERATGPLAMELGGLVPLTMESRSLVSPGLEVALNTSNQN